MSQATTAPSKIPKAKGNLLLGHFREYFANAVDLFQRCYREHGDVVSVRLLPWRRVILLFHPDHIEQVLRHDHKTFSKDKLTRQLSTFMGNGLLTSEGDFWKKQRHLIQPGFAQSHVHRYVDIMVDYTDRLLQRWQADEVRDVHVDMMGLTLEIVARALFNADVAHDAKEVGDSIETVMDFFRNPLNWPRFRQWIPTGSLLRFKRAKNRLYQIIDEIIQKRRQNPEDVGDLLAHLFEAQDEAGASMTDRQLRDELITLMLAGHETTALALSYSIYLMSKAPEVERKLLEEIDSVLGKEPPTIEKLAGMPYLDQIAQESMRLYPPAWVLGREALQDVQIGDYLFPKGSQIDLCQWVVHRDARWYEEPEEFRPERWTPEMKEKLPRGAYFPFGDGPRICVGQYFARTEMKIILAKIYQKFRFDLEMTEPLGVIPSITLRPNLPVLMRVKRR